MQELADRSMEHMERDFISDVDPGGGLPPPTSGGSHAAAGHAAGRASAAQGADGAARTVWWELDQALGLGQNICIDLALLLPRGGEEAGAGASRQLRGQGRHLFALTRLAAVLDSAVKGGQLPEDLDAVVGSGLRMVPMVSAGRCGRERLQPGWQLVCMRRWGGLHLDWG
jgi:hypothetical protein